VDGRCLSLRLTDGALSSDVFPCDYHPVALVAAAADRGTSSAHLLSLLPVKWMAVETLQTAADDDDQRLMSTASDAVRDHSLFYILLCLITRKQIAFDRRFSLRV